MLAENLIFALLLSILAGFMNGSFATPTKYMDKWKEENIWFIFSFLTFLIIPWIYIYLYVPNIFYVIPKLDIMPTVATLIFGGIIFGIGMVCFSVAFRLIGLGVNFVINLSIGTACTALVGMIRYPDILGSSYSYLQAIGVVIFIIAVIIGAVAGTTRDKFKRKPEESAGKKQIKISYTIVGTILAVIAGIGSAFQGVSYVIANPVVEKIANSYGVTGFNASTIAWVILFSFATIPYALYFFILNIKHKSFLKYSLPGTYKYWIFLMIMGIAYWLSLVLFSSASRMIGGQLGPTIAWPLFMVFIILTSNFCGFITGEWKGAGSLAKKEITISILMFILAIIIFSSSILVEPK